MARKDGRAVNNLREIKFTRNWLDHAEGSVLVEFGGPAFFALHHLLRVFHAG